MTSKTLHYADTDFEIHKVVVGPVENNVFVLQCRHSGDAVLIDAANEHEQLLELASRLGVRRVLETHGHWDHIQAIPQMRNAGYSVGVGSDDAHMLDTYDEIIEHDSIIEVGNLRLRTIHNPGHTPGSLSFAIVDKPFVFTGDTLFPGGPGNTTLEGGDFDTIIRSVDDLLLTPFHPDTIVMPGHGDDTTIGAERPFLDVWVERGW